MFWCERFIKSILKICMHFSFMRRIFIDTFHWCAVRTSPAADARIFWWVTMKKQNRSNTYRGKQRAIQKYRAPFPANNKMPFCYCSYFTFDNCFARHFDAFGLRSYPCIEWIEQITIVFTPWQQTNKRKTNNKKDENYAKTFDNRMIQSNFPIQCSDTDTTGDHSLVHIIQFINNSFRRNDFYNSELPYFIIIWCPSDQIY